MSDTTVMLRIIDGETDYAGGVPINLLSGQLPSVETNELHHWMERHGCHVDNPDIWVLVEPADDALGAAANQSSTREVEVTPNEMQVLRRELNESTA